MEYPAARNIKKYFTHRPLMLFMADGTGAALSAFLLGIILVRFHPVFGIPPSTLYILAVVPCVFVLYDLYVLIMKPPRIAVYLRGIAGLNLLYIILSLAFAIHHAPTMTFAGWGYFVIEIIIVAWLIRLEMRVAHALL